MMLLALKELNESPRIGEVKDEQYYHYSTFEDMADPNKRSARGNTLGDGMQGMGGQENSIGARTLHSYR